MDKTSSQAMSRKAFVIKVTNLPLYDQDWKDKDSSFEEKKERKE
jgi:hypothetical protein